MSMDNTMALELVRLMWDEGRARVEAKRVKEPMTTEQYFAHLQDVVTGIKAHLSRHKIQGIVECIVKFGEEAVVVLVDFSDMQVIPDPEDPTHPFFNIPSTRKKVS